MDVKTFEASTLKDALKLVKNEFGKDAVILSTKEKKNGGTNSVLVTASSTLQNSAPAPIQTRDAGHLEFYNAKVDKELSQLKKQIETINTNIPHQGLWQGLQNDMLEIRFLLQEVAEKSSELSLNKDLPSQIRQITEHLSVMGISKNHLIQLSKFLLQTHEGEEKKSEDFYHEHTIRWLLKKLKPSPSFEGFEQNIHVICGPSGSGKTTNALKLAHHFQKTEKKNVKLVFLSHSNQVYFETSKIYAKLLGLQYIQIQSLDELKKKLDRSTEIAIVDTESVSSKDPKALMHLLRQNSSDSLLVNYHVCLSITENEKYLDFVIRNYAQLGLTSVLFSKLDEAWAFGSIFNLAAKWHLPVSFFSNGARVPEDLEKASREKVIEKLVRS